MPLPSLLGPQGLACVCLLVVSGLNAQIPTKSYDTQLVIDEPISVGPNQSVTGRGAPNRLGVYVELWRRSRGDQEATSLGSVRAVGGGFEFGGIEVMTGDTYFATLSRSWQFDRAGDPEGWNDRVVDASLTIAGGVLSAQIGDLNGDSFIDPYIETTTTYAADFYKVLEIRIKNPTDRDRLSIFWGAPWPQIKSRHIVSLPTLMEEFQTILVPLNVQELSVVPGPQFVDGKQNLQDGLWTAGEVNTALRLDFVDDLQKDDLRFEDAIIEVDWIRLREDYRFEFAADEQGLTAVQDATGLVAANGALHFDIFATTVNDPPRPVLETLFAGHLDPDFQGLAFGFRRAQVARSVVGEGGEDVWTFEYLFADRDSTGFRDDGGASTLQSVLIDVAGKARSDGSLDLDAATQGEWSEDRHVGVMQLHLPREATTGDAIELDYWGLVPAIPYGPSEPVLVNTSPVAVAQTDFGDDPIILAGGVAEVLLDASGSDDGDGGVQQLDFLWRQTSGPGGVTLTEPTAPRTIARLTRTGDYSFELLVSDGVAQDATAVDFEVLPNTDPRFLRGDCLNDGIARLSDALLILEGLFRGADLPACTSACDTNSDGEIDISDPIFLLRFLFVSGPPPGSFPACESASDDACAARRCDV